MRHILSLGAMRLYVHLLRIQGIDVVSLTIAFGILILPSVGTSVTPALKATDAPVTQLLND
jgi:hypothetical protein